MKCGGIFIQNMVCNLGHSAAPWWLVEFSLSLLFGNKTYETEHVQPIFQLAPIELVFPFHFQNDAEHNQNLPGCSKTHKL